MNPWRYRISRRRNIWRLLRCLGFHKDTYKLSDREVNAPEDNGYISDYLIHWTGKKGDEHGANVLSTVASTRRLLLSYNHLHIFDWHHEVHEKMVCFTDVPLHHSTDHCKRYGRFGIAFHKLKLMNVGAQPVFYASHTCKRDMDTIFRFLQEQVRETTLPLNTFQALHRHFYFIQRFSDGPADHHDTFYYEREWRLGEQTLVPGEGLRRPYTGQCIIEGDKTYFTFDAEYVAFLVAPRSFHPSIENPHGFRIEAYENLVHGGNAEK